MSSAPPADDDAVEHIDPENTALRSGVRLNAGAAQQLLAAMGGGNPALMEAMQEELSKLVGTSSGFIESQPKAVRRRIEYLEELQEEHDDLQDKFEEEMAALEKKYRVLQEPLLEKRKKIVTGEEEAPPMPAGLEQEETPGTAEEKAAEGQKAGAAPAAGGEEDEEPVPKGIPQFWLNVLRNREELAEHITEKDEAVLEHLVDISVEELGGDDDDKMLAGGKGNGEEEDDDDEDDEEESGFRLTFTFAPNEFFSEIVLTKTYYMADDDAPVLKKAVGTPISWAPGKDPTKKLMKKKLKKGQRPTGKPQTKLEPVESFFNFFSPPPIPEEDNIEEDDLQELQEMLEADYELGELIKDQLIPRAVAWYTGVAVQEMDDEDEFDDDEDDDEDDEDDDEEDDEEDDEDGGGDNKPRGGRAPVDAKNPECKQQ